LIRANRFYPSDEPKDNRTDVTDKTDGHGLIPHPELIRANPFHPSDPRSIIFDLRIPHSKKPLSRYQKAILHTSKSHFRGSKSHFLARQDSMPDGGVHHLRRRHPSEIVIPPFILCVLCVLCGENPGLTKYLICATLLHYESKIG
jgi:hypothetical protein